MLDVLKESIRPSSALCALVLLLPGVVLLYTPAPARWGRRWLSAVLLIYWVLSAPLSVRVLTRTLTGGFAPIQAAQVRDAFADLIPERINRRGKMGFGVPLHSWFRGELRDYMRDLLLAPDARYRDVLSAPFVERLITRHLDGDANLGQQLWTVMCFELWLRRLPEWTSRGQGLTRDTVASSVA